MLQLTERPSEEELLNFLVTVLRNNPHLFTGVHHGTDVGCFMRAFMRGEPTFTLIGRDPTSPLTVQFWLSRNMQLLPQRVKHTKEAMLRLQQWPIKKAAD